MADSRELTWIFIFSLYWERDGWIRALYCHESFICLTISFSSSFCWL